MSQLPAKLTGMLRKIQIRGRYELPCACYTLCITACASNGIRKRTGQTERSTLASILKPHRAYSPTQV